MGPVPLLVLAVTSTAAAELEAIERDLSREEVPYEEEESYEEEDEDFEVELDEQSERWYSERGLHFTLGAGIRGMIAGDHDIFTVDVSLGFSRRFSQRWALQGRVWIGSGFGNTENGGLFAGGGPLFDSGLEATIRMGSRRFYFGAGPFGRFWHIAESGERFHAGVGGLLELGWLIGDDRQLDLGLHGNVGAFNQDSTFGLLTSAGVAVAWAF